MNQKGAIVAVLGILLFLGLIVCIIVGIVVGLDLTVQKENPGESIFSDDSEIKPMIEKFQEKRANLSDRIEENREERAAYQREQEEQNMQVELKKSKDPLGDVERHIQNENW